MVLAQLLWTLPTVIRSTQSLLPAWRLSGFGELPFPWRMVIGYFIFLCLLHPRTTLGKQRNGEVSHGRCFDQPKQLVLLNREGDPETVSGRWLCSSDLDSWLSAFGELEGMDSTEEKQASPVNSYLHSAFIGHLLHGRYLTRCCR